MAQLSKQEFEELSHVKKYTAMIVNGSFDNHIKDLIRALVARKDLIDGRVSKVVTPTKPDIKLVSTDTDVTKDTHKANAYPFKSRSANKVIIPTPLGIVKKLTKAQQKKLQPNQVFQYRGAMYSKLDFKNKEFYLPKTTKPSYMAGGRVVITGIADKKAKVLLLEDPKTNKAGADAFKGQLDVFVPTSVIENNIA